MTRRRTPSTGPSDPWTEALLVLGSVSAVGLLCGAIVWTCGATISLITGLKLGPSPTVAVRKLVDGGVAAVWPSFSPVYPLTMAAVVAGIFIAVGFLVADRWTAAHPRRDGFAPASQFAELLPGRTGRAKAVRLRPSLARIKKVLGADLGVPLGSFWGGNRLLRASWEDVVLSICAPRSGKTTCLAVPAVLDAPGPVLATSNKPDLWTLTAALRAEDTAERVWTFDPQNITKRPQTFVWNTLDGISTVADARRLAGHFIQEVRRAKDSGDFWDRDAEDLLTGLLLAAALDGQPLTQVGIWLTSVTSVQPRNILSKHGFTQVAETMTGRSQGAVETREGVYATARAAAACLSDPAIMAWVTPTADLDLFDPARFAVSRQTLFLLSKDGAGSAAPLVAAFADRVMLEAVEAAEQSLDARLDPPMVAVLDEAANVCRITELPRLYSHLGSRGVIPLTILQSRSQGQRVWGDGGMAELFGAATVKLIGAGVDEQGFAEELSKMVGEEDVLVTTRNGGKSGGTSRTTRRERVMASDEIRAMPKFTAMLLVTGVRPALLRLVPWMRGPHAERIRNLGRRL